jgi:predicted transcriptional regulator
MTRYENDAIKQAYELIISSGGRERTALIKDFMRPNSDVIHMQATLKEAIRVIVETKIDGVPVVNEHNKIVGMITKTLILREIYNNTDINTKVREIMKPNPLVTTPDKNLLPLIKFSFNNFWILPDYPLNNSNAKL